MCCKRKVIDLWCDCELYKNSLRPETTVVDDINKKLLTPYKVNFVKNEQIEMSGAEADGCIDRPSTWLFVDSIVGENCFEIFSNEKKHESHRRLTCVCSRDLPRSCLLDPRRVRLSSLVSNGEILVRQRTVTAVASTTTTMAAARQSGKSFTVLFFDFYR